MLTILAMNQHPQLLSVAEEYHQGYFRRNPNQGYCRAVITPKVAKFRKSFADRLKG